MPINDDELERALSGELRALVSDLSPRPDLYERVVSQHARQRRTFRAGAAGAAMAVAAAVIISLSPGAGNGTTGPQLKLAAYSLRLPAGYRHLAATSAACNPQAFVLDPGSSGQSPSDLDQPAVVSAATANGGCVSMLLSASYTPGASDAPVLPGSEDASPVQIGSYQGTVGTDTWIGRDMTLNGIPVASGTKQLIVNLDVPGDGGQVQDLEIAAEGLSQQQLISILSSGLSVTASSRSGASSRRAQVRLGAAGEQGR